MSIHDCRIHRDAAGKTIMRHEFHAISGWCLWGCGSRNDGRIISIKSGQVISPGRTYTREELTRLRAWIEQQSTAA
ncbi:hypothetical protein [Microbacterium paulum]